ncbi:uncharacterized protein [Ptychodera flava]|uniref:uncharacterized protein n=1 Tax=Ptychodera flava TaxID=63121 RepID=UPI003969BD4D
MFEVAAENFVEIVGKGSLIPSPSLEASIHCKPLSLVIQHLPKWPWQSPMYTPQPFKLHEVLEKSGRERHHGLPIISRKLVEFHNSMSLMARGKLGCRIVTVLRLNVQGSDSIDVQVNLGTIFRSDVDVPLLAEYLKTVYLNKDNMLVKSMGDARKQRLCVIVGRFYTSRESTIRVMTKKSSATEATLSAAIPYVASMEASVSQAEESNQTHFVTLPKFTTIAYKVCELDVGVNGALALMTFGSPALRRTEFDKGPCTSPDGDFNFPSAAITFTSLSSDNKQRLLQLYREVIASPCCIQPLLEVISRVTDTSDGEDDRKPIDVKNIDEKFEYWPVEWKNVLSHIGFSITEDALLADESLSVGMLESTRVLLEALSELSDHQCQVLSESDGSQLAELEKSLNKVAEQELDSMDENSNIPQNLKATLKKLTSPPPSIADTAEWSYSMLSDEAKERDPMATPECNIELLRVVLLMVCHLSESTVT